MSRSDTRSNILSNINQNPVNEFIKIKIGPLKFNKNGIAIIYKQEPMHTIVPIFFGIRDNNDYNFFTKSYYI